MAEQRRHDAPPDRGDGADPAPSWSGSPPRAPPTAKRTRVLLSCGPCRASKLKCDRAQPCGQCLKKGRPDGCAYAPRPPKKQPRTMAARLKRLEGMVRGMLDPEDGSGSETAPESPAAGQVVQSDKTTNFVGGTHFMAMLEDIDELKAYFEDPDDDDEEFHDPYAPGRSAELLIFSKSVPRSKDELLALLPDKRVIDRLMARYFNSNSPSQHILHMPTFSKEYNEFWQDPSRAPLHWLALLFMVTSLGLLFSIYSAPHELATDAPSALKPMDRFQLYRGAAAWALVAGKYSQPGPSTLQAFLLYTEAEFLSERSSQMNCYMLTSVLIRLMLKMGLHRDPGKVPGISAYDGEMRRRWWNLAIQIDMLVAFHLGLPCMIHGVDSDTALPSNLRDEDFGPDTPTLPSPRPGADYTPLSYPRSKAALCRVFALVARQAHALTAPADAEVHKANALLEQTWADIPAFMKVRPMDESITDPVALVVKRFALALLYQKIRLVLHRRYITETDPQKEHSVSRAVCLEAALALLEYQKTLFDAARPGAMLHQNGWFVSALAIHDYLLANVVIALFIQSPHYPESGGHFDWLAPGSVAPTKDDLLRRLRTSQVVWQQMALQVSDCQRAAQAAETLLRRVEARRQGASRTDLALSTPESMAGLSIDGSGTGTSSVTLGRSSVPDMAFFARQQPGQPPDDAALPDLYDWGQLDTALNADGSVADFPAANAPWFESFPLEGLDFLTSSAWDAPPGA